jgi:hypothetical protein
MDHAWLPARAQCNLYEGRIKQDSPVNAASVERRLAGQPGVACQVAGRGAGVLLEDEAMAAATSKSNSSGISTPPEDAAVSWAMTSGGITGSAMPPAKAPVAQEMMATDSRSFFMVESLFVFDLTDVERPGSSSTQPPAVTTGALLPDEDAIAAATSSSKSRGISTPPEEAAVSCAMTSGSITGSTRPPPKAALADTATAVVKSKRFIMITPVHARAKFRRALRHSNIMRLHGQFTTIM